MAKKAIRRPAPKKAGRPSQKKTRGAKPKRASAKTRKMTKTRDYFLHPLGVADSSKIGAGTRIWAFAHVLDGAIVGAHCNIGECVFVENGASLGDHVTIKNGVQVWTGVRCDDYVFVGPNATFTNDLRPRVANPVDPEVFAKTWVQKGASIGANATIVAGVTLGAGCLVGAGTVVIRDVPSHALVVGNPARRIGWICACGEKLNRGGDSVQPELFVCPACAANYSRSPSGLVPIDA